MKIQKQSVKQELHGDKIMHRFLLLILVAVVSLPLLANQMDAQLNMAKRSLSDIEIKLSKIQIQVKSRRGHCKCKHYKPLNCKKTWLF